MAKVICKGDVLLSQRFRLDFGNLAPCLWTQSESSLIFSGSAIPPKEELLLHIIDKGRNGLNIAFFLMKEAMFVRNTLYRGC